MEIEIGFKEEFAIDRRWHISKDDRQSFSYSLTFPIPNSIRKNLGNKKALLEIEERKKSQEVVNKHIKDLEELNAHKEKILFMIAHDLRSPLASIISIADHLKSNFAAIDPLEAKKMLDFLYDSSKDELNKLDSLVEWGRIKYASETFSPKNIDLRLYVIKVLYTLNQSAADNIIKLCNGIPKNTTIFADGKMLVSILQNIISNAIKYSNKGDQISIISIREKDEIRIEVKDNGIGMSKEIQSKLFTPQIDSLSKARDEKKGAGIGLLLAKNFTEKNSGKIWVKSKIGIGTTFYFTLPIKDPNQISR